MGVSSGAGRVFNWFANMTSVAGLLTWFGISCTYIRFYQGLKAQGYDRNKLPFTSKLQPYAAWYAASFCFLICLVGVLSDRDVDPDYLCFLFSSADGKFSSRADGQQIPS